MTYTRERVEKPCGARPETYEETRGGGFTEDWAFSLDLSDQDQVADFSEEEKQGVDKSISRIEAVLEQNGYSLPECDEIVFVKTTMKEEDNAAAYTHGYQIYLGEAMLKDMGLDNERAQRYLDSIMCHEIFHCLTRNQPQFRADMYRFINFTVQEEDFELTPEIHSVFLSNPDVGRHNSYATFTINGEKMDCFVVWVATEPFENPGDSFFAHAITGLVPIDDLDTLYTMNDAEDFWEVFGRNTNYVIDTEECMADNFGFAIMYEDTNIITGEPFKNPEILDAIRDYLKK